MRDAGNNGILVWRSAKGDDGTLVIDNRIEDIAARAAAPASTATPSTCSAPTT